MKDEIDLAVVEPLLECVGNTSLVELEMSDSTAGEARVYAKLETRNPGGSVRDRAVARMLLQSRLDGHFESARRVLVAAEDGLAISCAALGAAMGIGVTIVSVDAMAQSLACMVAHGAEVIAVHSGCAAARAHARRLADENPERYWLCDPYRDPSNWQAHYYGTAAEMLAQVAKRAGTVPDAFVAGVDSGGIMTGVGRRLRAANPDIHLAAVVPADFSGAEGFKSLDLQKAPPLLDRSLVQELIPVTEHETWAGCRALARRGFYAGPCAGACFHAALQLAAGGRFSTIVTLLGDPGRAAPFEV